MSRRTGVFACIVYLAALAVAVPAAAQIIAPPVTAKPAAPAAIPVADIPSRADTDERFAEEVRLRARGPDPAVALATRLDAISKSVDEKARLSRIEQLRTLPVLRLESLERHWNFDARQFQRWQGDMREATAPYASDAAELARRRSDWEATRGSTAASSVAPALLDRVDAVASQLKRAEQALSPPLERQIDLGRRANALDVRIQAGQKSVAAAIDYIDSRLVRIDAPPLWAIRDQPRMEQDALTSIRTGLEIESRFAAQYGAADLGNQRVLHVLQLLLLPLLLWLAYRTRKPTAAAPQADATERVLRRPLSTWLLLSVMGVLVFEPDAPLLLHQLVMLIAVVPVLRLLPSHAFRLLGPWPYLATALYLLERLGFLFLASDVAYRYYQLGLTVLALGLLLWLLWRSRRMGAADLTSRIARTVHAAAWFAVALLLVSVAANVFGNVSLAEMLTGGVIDSGYMGLALYAGVTVFGALLQRLVRGPRISRLRLARQHGASMLQLFLRLLNIAAVVGWLAFSMNRLRIWRPLYALAESVLTHAFRVGEVSITLGHVVVFVIAVLVSHWTARTVRYLLRDELLPKMSLPRGVGNSVASLSYYALLLLGLLFALAAAGFEIGQLALLFGALGVGIGFGLQNVVNNFVSGLILMFERPIQPGDVIEITGTSGRVHDIGMRATIIKTFEGADVVVPNGTLLSEKLTNWTLRDRSRRMDVPVGVAYGSEPAQVVELLQRVTRATAGVAQDPEPVALFMGLGANSLDFIVRAWTTDFDHWANIRSDLVMRIHAALVEGGIEVPFPQHDLHLRSVSRQAASMLAPLQPKSPSQDES